MDLKNAIYMSSIMLVIDFHCEEPGQWPYRADGAARDMIRSDLKYTVCEERGVSKLHGESSLGGLLNERGCEDTGLKLKLEFERTDFDASCVASCF